MPTGHTSTEPDAIEPHVFQGMDALLQVLARHQVAVSERDLPFPRDPEVPMLQLLAHAVGVGFEALPLGGDYDALDECPTPFIVPYGARSHRYAVVLDIGEHGVVLATPAGRVEVPESVFRSSWEGDDGEGDIVYLEPDEARMEQFLRGVAERRKRATVAQRTLVLYGLGGLLPAALYLGSSATAVTCGLAAAILFALAALSEKRCAACGEAREAIGDVPLAEIGALGYSALLGLHLLQPGAIASGTLALALGGHIYLVGILLRRRTFCLPCTLTATAVALAFVAHLGATPLALASMGALVLLGVVTMFLATRDQRVHADSTGNAIRLAQAALREIPRPPPGAVVLRAYTNPGCLACAYYHTVLSGLLAEEFGDALTTEERAATGMKIRVPLLIVRGAVNTVVHQIAPPHGPDNVIRAVRLALDPDLAERFEDDSLRILHELP